MVIAWSEEIRSSVFGWHNRDQRKQLWEYPRQSVLLGPMTFTKYGTSSWELRFQCKTQVMLLHGITEKQKKYKVSDSQALLREKRVRPPEDQVRRTGPRTEVTSFLLLAFLELRIVLWKKGVLGGNANVPSIRICIPEFSLNLSFSEGKYNYQDPLVENQKKNKRFGNE